MLAHNHDFIEVFLESMDEALRALLSQEVLDALYLNLEKKRSIRRAEIIDHLPILCTVLERHFGPGARTIGRTIARRLYAKTGLQFAVIEHYTLTNYVEIAKGKFVSASPSI